MINAYQTDRCTAHSVELTCNKLAINASIRPIIGTTRKFEGTLLEFFAVLMAFIHYLT